MRFRVGHALVVAALVIAPETSSAQQAQLQSAPTGWASTHTLVEQHRNVVAREKWRLAGRKLRGRNSAILRGHAIQQKLQMRTARRLDSGAPGTGWVSIGPKPLPSDASGMGLQDYGFVAGRATAVAIDRNDASGNTVFVGGAYGGVWKSSNAGEVDPSSVIWMPLTDDQPTLAIGTIAVQPQGSLNPDPASSVILAGTGETDSSTDSYYGLGIQRSADGGQTWSLISEDVTKAHSFAGLGFSQIAFSEADPNLVVAATGGTSQGVVEGLENSARVNRGLYYSTDAGLSWQAAVVLDSGVSISPDSATAVAYNPAATNNSGAPKFYAAIRYHGFYSSSDGINWSRLTTQPGVGLATAACPAQTLDSSTCPIYRGEIAFVPERSGASNLGEIYVWYVDASNIDQGIWTSTDGGASWTQINDSGIANCGDPFGGCGTEDGAFNLTLAAVPNGATATDLYAGAVNIYKCTITILSPTCSGSGSNTFLNLTHAFGCSDIAKIHPGQHGMDFILANGVPLIFFANDGGIYRALDGYDGLTTGTCGETNQFDNLNATLGPMMQFVSLSESANDANVIFGGTQDNGAAATAFSQSSGAWVNVDTGDNGFTAISPTDNNEWFVATPPDSNSGVNLFGCQNGVTCHSSDFQSHQIVDSSAVDGDTGPFELPFLLDPQKPDELILGTCRIWRGPSTGGGFFLLSPDFETGGTGSCSGNEINLIRSIAAGGLKGANGDSQTIYVGTNGEGPSIPTTPTGGHVWVTTNADGGPLTWTDVTQSINPQGFPISGIAMDSTDPLGKTAYVAIMGFHTAHVWKTTNAGATWTDFSGSPPNALPDAPVNTIVIDSGASLSNGTVYVGTDVGVFASSTGSPTWAEAGPASGQGGFLPNVAVTSLQIFNSGGLKRLRAATYGRGIWEWNLITTPDFQLNVSNNPLTIFASQSANFVGALYALNGYISNVDLSCTAGASDAPANCSATPNLIAPTANGENFSLTASGSVGDYKFNLHAAGTDFSATTHDFPLTLHIVDYGLTSMSPSAVDIAPGNTSEPISFQVTASGSFASTVALSCSDLPAGTACQFQPSSSISPTGGSPVSMTLNIATAAFTPAGDFPITINASVPDGPTKTQPLTFIVSNTPDYTISISSPSVTVPVNTSVSFNGTLTAMNGYNNSVSLTCGTGAPPTCGVSPSVAVPSTGGTSFSVQVRGDVSQTYNFNINAVGNDSSQVTHSVPVTFTATPSQTFDFTFGIAPNSASASVGQTTTFNLDVNPTIGSFPNSVTFACSKLPALVTCNFNPAQVSAGSQDSPVTFTISTTAPVTASGLAATPFLSAIPILSLLWFSRKLRVRLVQSAFTVMLTVFILGSLSCGGGLQGNSGGGGSGSPGTPPGTYTINVTATCGSITHTAPVTLTITP